MFKRLVKRDGVGSRFVYNAIRQFVGAGIFFLTTLILNQSLGPAGYATYFANWNVANLVVAFVAFGLYNEVIRRLAAGHDFPMLIRALWLPHLGQLAILILASIAVSFVWAYDWIAIFAIAASTTYGNLLVAISLGRDRMRLFMFGELSFNTVLLVLALITQPQSPRGVGYMFVGAVAFKILLYMIAVSRGSLRLAPGTIPLAAESLKMRTRDYTARAYAHSLLQIALFRGFFIAATFVLGQQRLVRLAVPWSFCDRSLLVVQGMIQLLYPQLLAGTITPRMKRLAKVAAIGGFLLATFGMALIWSIVSWREGKGFGDTLIVSGVIGLAFVPHVLRQLQLNEALAEYRFLPLFSSHAAAYATFIVLMSAAFLFQLHTLWFPILLVFGVSMMGLLGFACLSLSLQTNLIRRCVRESTLINRRILSPGCSSVV